MDLWSLELLSPGNPLEFDPNGNRVVLLTNEPEAVVKENMVAMRFE